MRTYKSPIFALIHEGMEDIYRNGGADKQAMQHFDEMCFTPVADVTPESIYDLRQKENLSKSMLATYMNVSEDIVSQWEQGITKPKGAELRLLSLMSEKGVDIFYPKKSR